MKKLIFYISIVCFACLTDANAQGFIHKQTENRLHLGLDLTQFLYIKRGNELQTNLGANLLFKPYRFLGLNAAAFYNSVDVGNGYFENLKAYSSKGVCYKLGFDVSIGISEKNKESRLFLGYNYCHINFREKAVFSEENYYWGGNYEYVYDPANKSTDVLEYTLGYRVVKGDFLFRAQIFSMFNKHFLDYLRVENEQGTYDPIFVPGFGYNQWGLNVILAYNIDKK
jgi:hypothetical protein